MMGRAPCCSKVGLQRGPWTPREDALLTKYIQAHGEGQWRSLPKRAGLLRCGKSCRLRWMNYLRPNIKRGNITPEEDDLIIRMHSLLGNRWSLIAGRLPGRTDNEIKNYWNTHLSKKLRNQGTGPKAHYKKLIDPGQEPAKKNSGGKKKNKLKNEKNKRAKVEEQEKTTVYLPKPIRVTALSSIPTNSGQLRENMTDVNAITVAIQFRRLPKPQLDDLNCDYETHIKTLSKRDSIFTLDSNSASASTSQEKEQGLEAKEVNVTWGVGNEGENEGLGFFDEDNGLVNGSDDMDQCLSDFHTDHGTLEKLYEEYLQLLKMEANQEELDSIGESLLV